MLERNIITFLKLVELESTVRCAQDLHLTQPAVTQHIRALEQEYNVKLFHKKGRKLVLTKKGKEFYDMAHRMHTIEKQIELRMKTEHKMPIRFGVTHSINEGVMPDLMPDFVRMYSSHEIELTAQNTTNLLKGLENGEIDFAFLEGNFDHTKYEVKPFMKADFVGLCKKGGIYSDCHSLHQLLDAPFFIREKGSGTRDILENVLNARGYTLEDLPAIKQFESIPVILSLVSEDLGITFAYEYAAKNALEKKILMPLPDSILRLKRQFWFATLPRAPFTSHALEFYEVFKKLAMEKFHCPEEPEYS